MLFCNCLVYVHSHTMAVFGETLLALSAFLLLFLKKEKDKEEGTLTALYNSVSPNAAIVTRVGSYMPIFFIFVLFTQAFRFFKHLITSNSELFGRLIVDYY